MIADKELMFSDRQDLANAPAGQAVSSSSVIDFANNREFGPTEMFTLFATFPNIPVLSGEGDKTVTITVDVSDNAQDWTSLEVLPNLKIDAISGRSSPFPVRLKPAYAAAPYRYMRMTYTFSGAVQAGTVSAGIVLNVPSSTTYLRNYAV